MQYPAELTREDGGFFVTFRDVPEAHTQGDTGEEALMHAVAALESAMMIYIRDRKPIPAPSPMRRGEKLVAVTVPQICSR